MVTILRKHLVGLTGLAWTLFLLTHVAGNLLILYSAEAYNKYSHALISNPFLVIAELGLVATILIHAGLAIALQVGNTIARPKGYAVSSNGEKKTSFVQKTLWIQGLLVLTFLILHILTFKYGTYYEATYDGVVMRDLHKLVIEVFQHPGYVVWYIICLVVLGMHLSHGISSSFQTLGLNHPKYTPWISKISMALSLFIMLGFIIQPLYVFFIHKG